MKGKGAIWLMTLGGAVLAVGGLVLAKLSAESQGLLRTLPFVMLGIGCGAFGGGLGELIQMWTLRGHPEIRKQMEIDEQDERNMAIANRAKAKAYDAMIFVFAAVMLSFALMEIDMAAILLLVCSYLFVVGIGCYYRVRYDREM